MCFFQAFFKQMMDVPRPEWATARSGHHHHAQSYMIIKAAGYYMQVHQHAYTTTGRPVCLFNGLMASYFLFQTFLPKEN